MAVSAAVQPSGVQWDSVARQFKVTWTSIDSDGNPCSGETLFVSGEPAAVVNNRIQDDVKTQHNAEWSAGLGPSSAIRVVGGFS